MENHLSSFHNFDNALAEVGLLIKFANDFEKNPLEYAALNKSALLLLTAKFEVFVEDVVREYIEEINLMNLTNLLISDQLKMKHSVTRIKEILDIIEHPNKEEQRMEVFKEIAKLWSSKAENFDSLNIPNKFNYGKHGSKEMEKLFKNIEIENVFETIKLYTDQNDSMISGGEIIDLRGIINNITNQRNKISHQDETPNITHKEIADYASYLNRFSKELCTYLEASLLLLQQQFDTSRQAASGQETAI
ncbi:MAE_28990/MAE_18760 family HEPN-like nuclease [Jeotgalibacillus salarius]|uniref:RiboL-PSP-HEPN domain-containing protein n=1 Tax=Jeotgalibacillus salarius TaxID=546023 RepID=A0A4Y8LF86_9BACL|nr:MAE_28990/MAE_18760 family HEPN-like nuclease [Jeotgalibacillus salarius]TFE01484.1 hypothetical protein E2626_07880 [Jeotgalibacillus salarius]